uniref:Uncharacterized protein n=1 Tax=Arundo donax TaxID=35708 RepID=A0A0A9AVY7_ARUDO
MLYQCVYLLTTTLTKLILHFSELYSFFYDF